jgi:DHA2 family multidrug resistance protein-like MFS transporter
MASSLGAALGVAISAAIFAALSHTQGFARFATIAMGRTDNVDVRFAASAALMFNVLMVAVAIAAIMLTIPKREGRSAATAADRG